MVVVFVCGWSKVRGPRCVIILKSVSPFTYSLKVLFCLYCKYRGIRTRRGERRVSAVSKLEMRCCSAHPKLTVNPSSFYEGQLDVVKRSTTD